MQPQMNQEYHVIGLMSGTSLDGLDMAYCVFKHTHNKWTYTIEQAHTQPYPQKWVDTLKNLPLAPIVQFAETDAALGRYMGSLVADFIVEHQIKPDFIASHGHTIFHQPEKGFTAQIGCGAAISAITGLPVINGFRNMDLALGGHGAPLVPVGDLHLFPKEQACLNLGGIANVSVYHSSELTAFDICPCNMVLNRLAELTGCAYDADGKIAASGNMEPELLECLNQLPYYTVQGPKSLGIEWVDSQFWPLVSAFKHLTIPDKMATLVAHIGMQIGNTLDHAGVNKVLLSGGGTLNHFLIESIRSNTKAKLHIPDNLTIHFKEALIFAFLGVLRFRNETNVYKEVTGSTKSHVAGAIWGNLNN
jgi:anhydro-N-acetylmuramic acid kinase